MRDDPICLDQSTLTASELDDDGFPGVQIDAPGAGDGLPAEQVLPGGLFYRPLDPATDADGNVSVGCPAFTFYDGGKRMAMPLTDSRLIPVLPRVQPGECGLFGPTGAFLRFHTDGSLTSYTTDDNTPTGRPVFWRVRPTGFFWESPYGRGSIDVNGIHFKDRGGARLDIGSIGGMPAPLGSLKTYATLQAAQVNIRGTLVSLGPDALPKDAVAKTTPITTYLTALEAALATAIGAAGSPAGATAAAAAFTTAMGPIHAALVLALPSQSTTTA